MFVKCNKCNTNYQLDDSLLKPKGRNVKCTNCKYSWFQPYVEVLQKAHPLPQNSSLPTIVEQYTPIWLKLLPIMFLCLVVITGSFFFQNQIVKIYPESQNFYHLLGLTNTENLKLEDILMRQQKDHIDIDGFIRNESIYDSHSPQIIISFSDENGKTLGSEIVKTRKEVIKQGNRKAFHKTISQIPERSHFLSVIIADKLDLFSFKRNN